MGINNLSNDAILRILIVLSPENRRKIVRSSKRFKKVYVSNRNLVNKNRKHFAAAKIQGVRRGIQSRRITLAEQVDDALRAYYNAQARVRGNSNSSGSSGSSGVYRRWRNSLPGPSNRIRRSRTSSFNSN